MLQDDGYPIALKERNVWKRLSPIDTRYMIPGLENIEYVIILSIKKNYPLPLDDTITVLDDYVKFTSTELHHSCYLNIHGFLKIYGPQDEV